MRRTLVLVVLMFIVVGCGGEEWPGASKALGNRTTTSSVRPHPTTTATTTTRPAVSHGKGPASTLPDIGSIGVTGAIAGNKALFDDKRAQLEAALDLQADPKLSGLSFDDRNNVVRVAFVSTHPERQSRPLYDDFAWQTGRMLAAEFWFPELFETIESHNGKAELLPRLRIQLDGVVYLCPAAVQIDMAKSGVDREAWLAACSD